MENTPLDSPKNKDHKTGKELKSSSEIIAFKKAISEESQEVVDSGKSKEEYYEKAIAKYGNIHEKVIVQIVGFALSSKTKDKNKNLIYVLILLQLLSIVSFSVFIYGVYPKTTTILVGILVLLLIVECLILSYLIKFNGQILSVLISLSAVKVFGGGNQILTGSYDIVLIINLSISISIMCVAAYLKKKLYPQYKLWAGPRKNDLGNYQF